MTAGRENLGDRVQLGERLPGVLQVMVHADHVVPAGQLVGECDEFPPVAVVDPVKALRLLDAYALVQPIEHGVRPDLAGEPAEMAVDGADILPRAGGGEPLDHVDPAAIAAFGRSECLFYHFPPETVVKVTVIEVQPSRREPRVLEDVAARTALFQGE